MKAILVLLYVNLIFINLTFAEEKPQSESYFGEIYKELSLRIRNSTIDSDTNSFNKTSLSAMLKFHSNLNEKTKLYLTLSTGNGSINSLEQNFDDAGAGKGINLHHAYFMRRYDDVFFLMGKQPNPIFIACGSNLIWDGDFSPEAITINRKVRTSDDRMDWIAEANVIWLDERKSTDASQENAMLYTLQYIKEIHKIKGMHFSLGYFHFTNLKGYTAVNGVEAGNTMTSLQYENEYALAEAFLVLDRQKSSYKYVFDYVINTAADDNNTGYLIGAFYKGNENHKWRWFYNYRSVEADAILGATADSSFTGGVTGGKGHTFNLSYKFDESMSFSGTLLSSEMINSGAADNRMLLDFRLKL